MDYTIPMYGGPMAGNSMGYRREDHPEPLPVVVPNGFDGPGRYVLINKGLPEAGYVWVVGHLPGRKAVR